MRINFRQGLVRVPTNFLSLANETVSLVIPSAENVIATFADGINNYLITERTSITDAWIGPFTSGINYWLYIDINIATGVRTFGHTLYDCIEQATAPSNPHLDQHWFNTIVNQMKVWNGVSWIHKIRVFAAHLDTGLNFVSTSISSPLFTGTQVGSLANSDANSGALVYDTVNGNPIKKSDGSFFTTEDLTITGIASSSHIKMGSIIIEAEAQSNIPSYSIVRFIDFNKVTVANNYSIEIGTYGIVDYGTTIGNIVNVTLEGLIENIAWDWTSAGINAPLYIDINGYLTSDIPPTPIIIAAVVDKHTILLRPSSLFLNTANNLMTTLNPGVARLSVSAVDVEDPIVVGDNDSRISSINPHIANNTVHLTTTENTLLDNLTGGTLVSDHYVSVSHANNTSWEYKTIQGTTNQIVVTNATGTTTLSLPQSINTTAVVSFGNVNTPVIKSAILTLTDAANISWNMANGIHATVTITDNRILDNPTNLQIGAIVILKVVQDAIGNNTLSYDTAFNWVGGAAPVISTGANTVSILSFFCDGTTLHEISRALNIS